MSILKKAEHMSGTIGTRHNTNSLYIFRKQDQQLNHRGDTFCESRSKFLKSKQRYQATWTKRRPRKLLVGWMIASFSSERQSMLAMMIHLISRFLESSSTSADAEQSLNQRCKHNIKRMKILWNQHRCQRISTKIPLILPHALSAFGYPSPLQTSASRIRLLI